MVPVAGDSKEQLTQAQAQAQEATAKNPPAVTLRTLLRLSSQCVTHTVTFDNPPN